MLALIPLFPLVGFLVNGCWYLFGQAPKGRKKVSAQITGSIASLFIALSFLVSLACFMQLLGMEPEHRVLQQKLFSWIHVGNLDIDLSFRIDSLSTLFTLVITGVGSLIHIYSIGYMAHDETPGKFFAYLNLFCFAMLVLVLGSSLPVLFFGWEGVGLCSYLLIGYWYTDIEKSKAGKKAFVVNRVGDLGFLLGMFLLFTTFGSLEFEGLRVAIKPYLNKEFEMTLACLFLFVGCMGKSAQVPLYVWLADAMAGPTPVSALIHAATMVTSGVYMVARLNFLYSFSPVALHVMAWVGIFTAFFAATIALVQKDIKKVLAYSTVSQLGYMFLACGVGAYTSGVFHVITHAFFKALLFLGAGSVIHGMHEEQDIWKMGGLKTRMPKTYQVFLIALLAICGVPIFSGFFSKDEILWHALSSSHGSSVLWSLGLVTAMMTAFYMTRLFYLVFLGRPRFKESRTHHRGHQGHHDDSHGQGAQDGIAVHESPPVMIIPLQILAFLSVVGGFMGLPFHGWNWLESWLDPVISAHGDLAAGISPSLEWASMLISVGGAGVGITFAWKLYQNLNKVKALARQFSIIHRLLENKWYVDEIYEWVVVRPIYKVSEMLWTLFDVKVIDRMVVGFGKISEWTGGVLRVAQTGSIQMYALMLLVGLVITTGYLVYGWT